MINKNNIVGIDSNSSRQARDANDGSTYGTPSLGVYARSGVLASASVAPETVIEIMDTVNQPVEALTRALQGARHSIPLQSLRGIAALIVLLFHCSIYFNQTAAPDWIFGHLFNGPASVLSFFVLSGFVLTLSQIGRPLTFGGAAVFYVRRLCRIYPALWVAVAMALLYHAIALREPVLGPVSSWWRDQIHPQGLSHRLLVETLMGKATELTLPIWTLNIELLGSAIMPLVIFGVVRARWSLLVLLGLLFALGVGVHVQAALLLTGFVYGACLALLCGPLRAKLTSRWMTWLLAATGFSLLWFGRSLFGYIPDQPYGPIGITVSSLGAALLIAVLYARAQDFPFLSGSAVVWLGDVSYSFYLLHMPIMGLVALGIGHLGGRIPALPMTFLLMLATVVLTGLAATVSYRLIEVPGVIFGKWLVSRLRSHR